MASPEPGTKFRLRFKHYILIVLVGIVALVAWVSYLGSEAETEFASLATVCDGKPVASRSAAGGRGIAFERDLQQAWRVGLFRLPDELTAKRADSVAYVVCLEPEKKNVVGRCGFREGVGVRVLGIEVAGVSTGGITTYQRLQYELPVRVVAPQTGTSLADGVLRGSLPPACDRYVGKPSESSFEGSGVDTKAVGTWLVDHLPRR